MYSTVYTNLRKSFFNLHSHAASSRNLPIRKTSGMGGLSEGGGGWGGGGVGYVTVYQYQQLLHDIIHDIDAKVEL
jgi:hypothetical protein